VTIKGYYGKKRIVVLTGAGVSAESGIRTFRDSGGLWEEHDIMDVATPEAWERNMDLVLEFYNQRRKQLFEVKPNAAHYALVELEKNLTCRSSPRMWMTCMSRPDPPM
jgi:NAD-dependent deacetylase